MCRAFEISKVWLPKPEAGLHRDVFTFEDVDILSRYVAYPASGSSFREQTYQKIVDRSFSMDY